LSNELKYVLNRLGGGGEKRVGPSGK